MHYMYTLEENVLMNRPHPSVPQIIMMEMLVDPRL